MGAGPPSTRGALQLRVRAFPPELVKGWKYGMQVTEGRRQNVGGTVGPRSSVVAGPFRVAGQVFRRRESGQVPGVRSRLVIGEGGLGAMYVYWKAGLAVAEPGRAATARREMKGGEKTASKARRSQQNWHVALSGRAHGRRGGAQDRVCMASTTIRGAEKAQSISTLQTPGTYSRLARRTKMKLCQREV